MAAPKEKTESKQQSTTPTMRSLQCLETGDPLQVIKEVKETPRPKITKKDQILCKVYYAAVNPIDWKLANGQMGFIGSFMKKPPFIMGSDFCGKVLQIGPNVKNCKVGDIVNGIALAEGTGAMAEYVVVSSQACSIKPKSLSNLQAAAVPLVTQTSYQALAKAGCKKGDRLLIFGGSTSVGMAAIQIAKNAIECAEVVVTSSSVELCKSLGADEVVNYKEQKWDEVLKDRKFDVVYDCVGGKHYWDGCRKHNIIKSNGYFVTIVGDKTHGDHMTFGTIISSGGSIVNRKFWGAFGNQKYDMLLLDVTRGTLAVVNALIENGQIKPMIDSESPFKFDEFLKLFAKSTGHTAKGKLVLEICADDNDDDGVANVDDDAKENDDNKVVEEDDNNDKEEYVVVQENDDDDGGDGANADDKEANAPTDDTQVTST